MTNSDPTGMHEWHSPAYVEEWIGGWDGDERKASLRRIPYLLPFDPDSEIRVLDIGGGWGPVTSVVLEAFPGARVTLLDFSEPMLDAARERLAAYSDSVSFVRGDLMTPDWKAPIEGQFDAVVTCLCIHNVRFPDRIRAIYGEIFPLVAPGGCFVSLDQVRSPELASRASRHAQLMEHRRQIYEDTGGLRSLAEVEELMPQRRRGDRDPGDEARRRMASHEPATLANQMKWLSEAGFDAVECFAREANSALIGAFRAG